MNLLERFKGIKTFIFDVDGVLTDGYLLVTEDGDMLRRMNVLDGYAMKRATTEGYNIFIITGGSSQGVVKRLERLGIKEVHYGINNKLEVYNELVERYELDEGAVLYMGDDLADYEVMRRAGIPACPQTAVKEIIDVATYISPNEGGQGCVRDVIEKVMRLNDNWL